MYLSAKAGKIPQLKSNKGKTFLTYPKFSICDCIGRPVSWQVGRGGWSMPVINLDTPSPIWVTFPHCLLYKAEQAGTQRDTTTTTNRRSSFILRATATWCTLYNQGSSDLGRDKRGLYLSWCMPNRTLFPVVHNMQPLIFASEGRLEPVLYRISIFPFS